jgi:hypothetical protein
MTVPPSPCHSKGRSETKNMYKDSIWAKEIIARQNREGSWGFFHTLSEPRKYPITTEQALRRLQNLGYTIDDEPIEKAVSYMSDCLAGKKQIPDRREKLHDWDIFTNLMLSTWIRRFTNDIDKANLVAETWSNIITYAFLKGKYIHDEYVNAYETAFGMKPRGGRLVDFVSFYQVSLISNQLDESTESKVFDYILDKEDGIYYIYDRCLSVLPDSFISKQASRYLGAIELLSSYRNNISKLKFVTDWLKRNQNQHGYWDMGSGVKDNIYFPLSNTWRKKKNREMDCTNRIKKLLITLDKIDIG